MKRLLLLLPVAFLVAITFSACGRGARNETAVVQTSEFVVGTTPRLSVVNFGGDVDVVTGDAGRIGVELRKQSSDPDSGGAQTDLDRIKLSATQTGDEVSVVVEYVQPKSGKVQGEHASAAMTLTVPPATVLNLVTGRGNVSVPEGAGSANVIVANGNVAIHLPAGAAFTLGGVIGNGSVTSDFDGVKEGQHSGPLAAVVGRQPGVDIKVSIGNGKLSLLKNR